MLENKVNAHLDRNCHEDHSDTTKKSLETFTKKSLNITHAPTIKPIKRPERLAKLNFSMLKDFQLKKKLAEFGLNQGGSRQAMEKRCTEWITLWNSNCDATRPISPRELRSELERWERIQDGKAPGAYYSANHGVKIREKDFDGKAWSEFHTESFKDLTVKARRKFETSNVERVLPERVPLSRETSISLNNANLHPATLNEDMKMNNNSLSQQLSPQSQREVIEENHTDLLTGNNEILPT